MLAARRLPDPSRRGGEAHGLPEAMHLLDRSARLRWGGECLPGLVMWHCRRGHPTGAVDWLVL